MAKPKTPAHRKHDARFATLTDQQRKDEIALLTRLLFGLLGVSVNQDSIDLGLDKKKEG